MIICKTPFRVSFFGGGTDFPTWYKNNEGAVVSTTINKYCYIILRDLPNIFEYKYRLRYYKTEQVRKINDIQHNAYREIIKKFNFKFNCLEIVHNADLPALSGLGSSSSSTVCLINALNRFKGKKISKNQLAKNSIDIEQNILRENAGSQDQIAASYGGFNFIKFKNNKFKVFPIRNKKNINYLSKNILIFFTGITRKSETIEKSKIKSIKKGKMNSYLNELVKITKEGYKHLESSNFNLERFGELLNKSWEIKKKLSNKVSNKKIDRLIKTGINNGAVGAKLLGAGAGGFLLFVCPEKKQKKLVSSLTKIKKIDFEFEKLGSHLVNLKN